MNYIYLYNGNFINLLSLIDILITENIKPDNIKNSNYSPTLFEQVIKLEVSDDENILMKIKNNTNDSIFKIMYYVFLSENENKELIIYYFYLNALKYKNSILCMRNLKCVSEALRISQYVSRENHKYKGFVRFRELKNNVLYAEIEPNNNILDILSNHFKNRLKNEYWIIKDVKRNIISVYDKKEFYLIDSDKFKLWSEELSNNENEYKDLWKLFYNTIGIKERKNDRCRMNFMPKRYWKYITEMSDDNETSN